MGFWSNLGKIFKQAIPTAINVGTDVGAAKVQSDQLSKAVDELKKSAGESNVLLEGAGKGAADRLNPYLNFGKNSMDQLAGIQNFQLKDLMDPNSETYKSYFGDVLGAGPAAYKLPDPKDVLNDPGIQFALGEGEKAITRQRSALGGLASGATGMALTRYGQGVASQGYNDLVNRSMAEYGLARDAFDKDRAARFGLLDKRLGVIDTTLGQLNTSMQAGQGAATDLSKFDLNIASQMGGNLQAGANAAAAGSIQQGNIWSDQLTNIVSQLSELMGGKGGGIPDGSGGFGEDGIDLGKIGAKAKDVLGDIGKGIGDVGKGIWNGVEDVGGALGDVGKGIGKGVLKVGDKLGDVVGFLGKNIGEGIGDVGKGIGKGVLNIGDKAKDVLGDVGEGIGDVGSGIGKGVLKIGDELGDVAGFLGKNIGKGVSTIGKGIGTGVGAIGKAAATGFKTLAGAFGSIPVAGQIALGAAGAVLLARKVFGWGNTHEKADKWVQTYQNEFDQTMASFNEQLDAGEIDEEQAKALRDYTVAGYFNAMSNFESQGKDQKKVIAQARDTFNKWYGEWGYSTGPNTQQFTNAKQKFVSEGGDLDVTN